MEEALYGKVYSCECGGGEDLTTETGCQEQPVSECVCVCVRARVSHLLDSPRMHG